MKHSYSTLLSCLLMLNSLLATEPIHKLIEPKFTISDPGQTHVFVKNHGQFNISRNAQVEKISYVLNSSDQIYFTPYGYVWKLHSQSKNEYHEEQVDLKRKKSNFYEKKELEQEETLRKIETHYVKMNWEGANTNCEIVAEEEAGGYYTYAIEGFRDLKAKGYQKLIYKEVYPGIAIEYILPKGKGGIKYSFIVNPGADIKQIKMRYEGDIDKIRIDKEGNLLISTPAGDMIDHAPQSFYTSKGTNKNNKAAITSSFVLTGNTVSFKLTDSKGQVLANNSGESIIIDPWTIAPNLFGGTGPYDVDYDKYGNVYIDFSILSCPQISKYSPNGVFLWTIDMTSTFYPFGPKYYSDFCVIPSGSVFIAMGYGNKLCKIDNGGNLLSTVTWPVALNNEGWVVAYNKCLNTLLIGGGGTMGPICLRMGVDTSLAGSFTGNSFNGSIAFSGNDMARMVIDDNGGMFSYFNNPPNNFAGTENTIFKSVPPYNAVSFSQPRTTCRFSELWSIPNSNRLNVLDINSNYLYFFDGKNLEARNKGSGALISSIVVSASYICGGASMKYKNEGIAVDECNNVYVGGQGFVHVFNFNGSTFSTLPTIAVNGNVYDIMLDKAKQLIYVTGNGFLSSFDAIECSNRLLITPASTGACIGNGTATANVSGGAPVYTYTWSNGLTTNFITSPPGTYTVTVTDGSCGNPQITTATITIDSNCNCTLAAQFTKGTAACSNCGCQEWVLVNGVNGTPPYTYQWPDGYDKRYKNKLCPGNYTVKVTDTSGCSVDVNITAP